MLSRCILSNESLLNCKIKVLFNSRLFQQYEVILPNSQSVDILLANATLFLDKNEKMSTKEINFQIVHNPLKWIQMLAIKKKMGEYSVGPNLLRIGIFDGVVYQRDQQWYGAFFEENTQQIRSSSYQYNQIADNHYRSMLADYHAINVVFSKIEVNQLRWKHSDNKIIYKFALGQNWQILYYEQQHRCWAEKCFSPYEQDLVYLSNAVSEMKRSSLSKKEEGVGHTDIKQVSLSNIFSKLLSLLEQLYSKNFESFLIKYNDICKKQFIFRQNKQLSQQIKQFYTLKRQYQHLNQFISWYQKQFVNSLEQDCYALRQLQYSVLEKKYIQIIVSIQKEQSSGRISFQEIKKIQNTYHPFFRQSSLFCKKNKSKLQQLVSAMKKDTQYDRFMWHFIQSKINWKQGLFYRALGHLKQCRKLSNQNKMLLVIELEEGRNYQQLGDLQIAEQHYRQGLKLSQWVYGENNGMVLFFLYNLQLICIKQNDKKLMNDLNKKIIHILNQSKRKQEKLSGQQSVLKQKYKNNLIRQIPQLCYSFIIQQFVQETNDSLQQKNQFESKERRLLSRDQIMKLQVERMPVLLQLWNGFKLAFDKNSKNTSASLKTSLVGLQGQLYIHSKFLQLIKMTLSPTQYIYSEQTEIQMDSCLQFLKKSNIRYYHRFLFCLSYVWQKTRLCRAIECIEFLLAQSKSFYSNSVRFSVTKRLIYLYEKNKQFPNLLKLYQRQDIIGSEDMQQIYRSVEICQVMDYPLMVIRNAQYYLKGIVDYPTISQQWFFERGNPSNKLVNRSISVKLALIDSFISMRHYKEAEEMINEIQEHSKASIWIMKFKKVFLRFAIQTYNANEIEFCVSAFERIRQYEYVKDAVDTSNYMFMLWKIGLMISCKITLNRVEHIKWLKDNYLGYQWQRQKVNNVIQLVLAQIQEKSSYFQLVEFLTQIKDKESNKSIMIQDILNNISKVSYLDQSRFAKYIEDFIVLFRINTSQHWQYFNLIKTKIQELENSQGRNSFNIKLLHLLLLIISIQEHTIDKTQQMLLLSWLAPFTKEIALSSQLTDFWASKNGRDLRLDQLLFIYFGTDKGTSLSSPLLQGLWWIETVKQNIQLLRLQYRNIVDSELGVNDMQLQIRILNFKIKYSCYFVTNQTESDTYTKLDEILSQLDCFEDFDDI